MEPTGNLQRDAGECRRNPSYMRATCKRECDALPKQEANAQEAAAAVTKIREAAEESERRVKEEAAAVLLRAQVDLGEEQARDKEKELRNLLATIRQYSLLAYACSRFSHALMTHTKYIQQP